MTRVRIVLLALLTAVIVMNQPRIAAQEKALLSRLQVGTHVYFPDGGSVARWHRFDSAATKPGSAFEMYTSETLCVFNTDAKRPPAGYGWQITVIPIKELGDTLVFRVDWTRTRDRGRVTDTPKGSVELALKSGKSVPLDYIVPGPTDTALQPCSAVGMLLQVDLRQ